MNRIVVASARARKVITAASVLAADTRQGNGDGSLDRTEGLGNPATGSDRGRKTGKTSRTTSSKEHRHHVETSASWARCAMGSHHTSIRPLASRFVRRAELFGMISQELSVLDVRYARK